ncbi:iron-siderophore ABC transporter substrate-binding protein [Tropicimonas sp.]|uniref:iron-siderophore ABC transporter substrate-binding protein n=1 Tax=Tropicimonas sp. TaxID=2067044 RepID=UPI003A8BC9BF
MLQRILTIALVVIGMAAPAIACDGRLMEQDTVYGAPLCLPPAPKRVIVLDPGFSLGIGLDAGLPVVGAPLERMGDADLRARAEAAGVTSLGFVTEPSLEALVALQPDLIVGFMGDRALAEIYYPMLSALAPTLLDISGDWRAFYHLLAGFTGREAEVGALFAGYDARLADIRARMPQDRTVSVLRITSWDFQVYTDAPGTYAPFAILAEAGVRRSTYETDDQVALKRPDWEELAALDGDILLYIIGGTNDSGSDGRHEEVLGNPLFQMLPAVRAGRVHRLDPGIWMEFNGLGSAGKVFDDIERYILGAP